MLQNSIDIQAALYQLVQEYRSGRIGKSAEETRVTLRTLVDLLERPNGPLSKMVSDRQNASASNELLATELVSNLANPDSLSASPDSQFYSSPAFATVDLDKSDSQQCKVDLNAQATEYHGTSRANRSHHSKAMVSGQSSDQFASYQGTVIGAGETRKASPDTDTIVGTMHHRIVQRHAEGGLGAVYLATDDELHRAVALKEIKANYATDSSAREQFLLEAQITARLTHPGIVPVYAIGAYPNGRPYYTMRVIEGQTLLEAIKQLHGRRGTIHVDAWQLELKHLIRRYVAACHAIAYAHNEGYLHRDIKPQNMMLGAYGETLVVDWGLAIRIPKKHSDVRLSEEASSPTERNHETRFHLPPIETPTADKSIVGTPAYMSPEQTLGRVKEIDERSDIFSLGCTLYEISTGEVAFGGTTRQEVTDKILTGVYSEPRTLNPSLPKPLAAICIRALGRSKHDRYSSVNELVLDLERWLDDEPPSVYRLTIIEQTVRWVRRHKTIAISGLTATLATLMISLVALFLVSREQQRTAEALQRESLAREQTLAALDTVTDETISQTLARQTELDDADKQFFQNILLQYEKLFPADESQVAATDPGVGFQRARGLQRVGTLRRQLSMLDESESELRSALEMLSSLDSDAQNVLQALAKTHFELGLLLAAKQSLEPAAEQYKLASKYYAKVHESSREDSCLCHAAIAENNYANVMWRLGRKAEARAAYEEALQALPVSLAMNSVSIRQKRILLLNNYAGTLKSDAQTIADAISLYQEAVSLIDRGLDQSILPSDTMAIAATLTNLAAVQAKTGKIAEAKDLLNRSIDMQQPIVDRFPGYSTYQQQFAKTQLQLALTLASMKQPTASQQLETAQRSLQALANRFPERPSYQVDLADAIEMQTRSQYGLDSDTAKAKLEEVIAIRKSLADEHRSDVSYLRGLLATRIRYANELRNQRLYADAVLQYEQILATLDTPEIAATGLGDGKARNRALFGIADSLIRLGDYSQALEFWDQLLKFEDDPDYVDFHLQRILCLMRLTRVDQALDSIDSLKIELAAKNVLIEPVQHYDLACCYSVGSETTEVESQKLQLLDLSIKELALAEELGFFKDIAMVEHARSDEDLSSLRSYSTAHSLLQRIGILVEP